MSHEILERRYRALLRSYPAPYRRERSDEMLEVLLGDAPTTRRWPELHQAIALVRGGLRVRGGSTAGRPAAVLLWQGMHLAAVAVLAVSALFGLDFLMFFVVPDGISQLWERFPVHTLNLVLVLATLVTLVLGWRRTALALVVAAMVAPNLGAVNMFTSGAAPAWWGPFVAAPLMIAGFFRPADVPPVGVGDAALVTAPVLVLHLVSLNTLDWFVELPLPAPTMIGLLAVLAAFLWIATADPRLLLAAAPTFLLVTLSELSAFPYASMLLRPMAVPSLLLGMAMALGAVMANRRRRVRA
ncbi:hypothetical protein [Actinoplanes sp. NPDC051859]|uniref:hypothetical protein n=1 Tax=Actinoplanes sp. NPDC051859 TaxID=3363909 RepID=UPI00379DE42F